MTSSRYPCRLVLALVAASGVSLLAQAGVPGTLSLAQAQELALRQHPQIGAGALIAQAARAVTREARAAYFPTLTNNTTAVGAEDTATASAGALTTSSLYSRLASGVVVTQLVTDFGRTSRLTDSARLRTLASDETLSSVRARVLLDVQTAYFRALSAQAVLRVANQTTDLRRLTLRQVTALAQSGLRSTLDVSFAQVNVSEAELALSRAASVVSIEHARLSSALGYDRDQPFTLLDEPFPAALPDSPEPLIERSLHERPDLAALRHDQQALDRFADAEARLRNPTVSAAAAAGVAPLRDERLRETYSAAGVNVSVPILNGGLFGARRAEAQLRASAAGKEVEDATRQIARDVRVAWLEASDALRRLDVVARLVEQANDALRLAQARYDAGLGSIVELNQAQVNQTAAQMDAASAQYDYLITLATLNYATGALH